jgi:hypothetical protein
MGGDSLSMWETEVIRLQRSLHLDIYIHIIYVFQYPNTEPNRCETYQREWPYTEKETHTQPKLPKMRRSACSSSSELGAGYSGPARPGVVGGVLDTSTLGETWLLNNILRFIKLNRPAVSGGRP